MYTLFWWLLTGGVAYSWWFGVPIILIATALSLKLDAQDHSPKLTAIPAFFLHFIYKSVGAGVDVAYRTLHPKLPLKPGLVEYPLTLPEGRPRVFLTLLISLLPGTLSADIKDHVLTLHVLDTDEDIAAATRETEQQVARLFGLELNPPRNSKEDRA
ncbi:Na+/H+ antiporter subunit E [Aliidiomarina sp.]|uniref:Na+/H+ antiporter subunit E n=1 Tax=Aliidiomarina sp. TaxID=1872439 RepID=UPI0025C02922|nr:Na+/H+ antiporter subunit E [Aliidiomarina sp.]